MLSGVSSEIFNASNAKSWSEAGLPFLESENVPLPNIPYTNVFCFPKMQARDNDEDEEDANLAKALQSEKHVVKFMTAVGARSQ